MRIDLQGPYRREKKKIFDPEILFAIFLGIVGSIITILLVCMFIFIFSSDPINNTRTYIPRKELHRIQRYHGTKALKIVGEKVWIWRDGGWLRVHRMADRHVMSHLPATLTAASEAKAHE